MRNILKVILCSVFLIGVAIADEAEQVRMLKQLLAQPEDRWQQMLAENKALLDPEFFQRIEQRIRWDLANCYQNDAIRFAHIGDLALGVVGEKPRFVAIAVPQRPTEVRVEPDRRAGTASDFPAKPAESREAILEARAAELQGRTETAERLYRQSLVDNPKSWTGWLELARFHETHRQFEMAAQEYQQMTRLWPRQGKAWLLRAKCAEARFDRLPDWNAVDEARLCYSKAVRLGQDSQSSVDRVNGKAKELAKKAISLNGPLDCEMRVGEQHEYIVGASYGLRRPDWVDPYSGRSGNPIHGEWHPLAALPGESLEDYLERSYSPRAGGEWQLFEPQYLVTGGLWRGETVWLRSAADDTRLCVGGRVIGTVNSPRLRWPLRNPFARFRDRVTGQEIELFRSPMFEIGLEVSDQMVTAVYLAEPGRLRVNLQRLPRYREL